MLKNGVQYDCIHAALRLISRDYPDMDVRLVMRGKLHRMWRDHNLPTFVARTEWQSLWAKIANKT